MYGACVCLFLEGKVSDRQLLSAQAITSSVHLRSHPFGLTPSPSHTVCRGPGKGRSGGGVSGGIRHAVHRAVGPRGALRGTLALF